MINKIIGVMHTIFIISMTVGVLKFLPKVINGLDWDGITFYGLITLLLVWKLGDYLSVALTMIFKKDSTTK